MDTEHESSVDLRTPHGTGPELLAERGKHVVLMFRCNVGAIRSLGER